MMNLHYFKSIFKKQLPVSKQDNENVTNNKVKNGYSDNEAVTDILDRIPPWINTLDKNILFVFAHIPKAGGTSLNGYLAQIYGCHMAKYHSYFNPELVYNTTSDKAKDILCISSHYGYGVHRLFGAPGPNKLLDEENNLFAGRDIRYVTIVRNPLERMLSYYNFVTTFPAHHHYEAVKDMSIYQFFDYLQTRNDPEYSNLQCYLITGRSSRSYADAREILENKFYSAAPLEKSDELIKHLSRRMNWPSEIFYEIRNVSPKKATSINISDDLRDFLLESNGEDYKLYQYVVDNFSGL